MKKETDKIRQKKHAKGKKKWILVGLLCILAVVAGSFFLRKPKSRQKGQNQGLEVTVETRTIETSVSGTGTISYADSTDIVLPADLEMGEMLVSEGSYIEEGALLATVDAASLAACLSEVEEAISDVDSTISSEKSSSTSQSIKAGISGRVKKIYADEDDSVVDVMKEYGALLLLSIDELMTVDLDSVGNVKVGDVVTVSNGDEETTGTVETIDSGTAVITFDDSVFEYEEEVSVKNEDGIALGSGTAYIHQSIAVVGTSGIISSLNVSLNQKVSAATKVYTLNSSAKSAAYLQAVKEREQLVSLLDTLISIQTNGGIVATAEGMIETINVEGTSASGSNASQSNMMMGDNSSKATTALTVDVAEQDDSIDTTDTAEITMMSASQATNGIGFTTMSLVGTPTEQGDFGKIEAAAPQNLTVGAGVIKGTTADMEYADEENAVSWIECSMGETKVGPGTWYVRYKETETTLASPAVKVVVTQGTQDSSDQTGGTTESNKEDDNKKEQSSSEQEDNREDSAEKNETDKETGNSGQSAGATRSGSSVSAYASSSGTSSSASASTDSFIETVSGFVIAKGDKMKVTMNVDELDILSMEEGLSAEITLDAVEGTIFEGTITAVSGSVSSSGGSSQYPVEITFNKTEDMLSGMNASVEVIMERAENVLVVPLAAVEDEGDKSYVYTGYDESAGELTDKVEVILGLSDESYVEIVSGLSEGDTIYYQMQGSEDGNGGNGMGGFGMPGGMDGMPSGRQEMRMDGEGRGDRSDEMPNGPSGGMGGPQ